MNTTLNQNRSFNLFIVAGIVIALVVVALSTTMTSGTAPNVPQNITGNSDNFVFSPRSANAFPGYRQSEWHSSSAPVTSVSGSEMYHQSERTLIPTQAGLNAYQLSERTLVNPLVEYLQSERTLIDIQSGMAAYFQSERTSVPLRDLDSSNEYQRSEWFGK